MTDNEVVKKVVARIEKQREEAAREKKARIELVDRTTRLAAIVAEKTGVDLDDAFWLVGRAIEAEEGN